IQLSIREVKAAVDKKPNDLILYANQYLETDPYCANKMYAVGWASFNTEQWQNAIDAFEKNIALLNKFDRRSWIWSYLLLGRAYHEIGEHKKENKIYEEGLNTWPKAKYRIVYNQAICALSRGDSIEANQYFAEFKAWGEQNGWNESDLLYWFGSAYVEVDNFEQAERLYRKALAINPEHSDVKNSLAYLLISNDINIDEGMELIKSVLETDPDNGNYLHTYGMALYKQGELIEAQEVLKNAWDLIPYYDHVIFLHIQEVEQALARPSPSSTSG
ncbi:MAG: tetratricopeptide repeat protein, partial [Bacteroides sp.]|nr:tetratricopeptide repeat protein [Bacteroides sp.]